MNLLIFKQIIPNTTAFNNKFKQMNRHFKKTIMEKHGITFIILTALTQLKIYSTQS